MASTKDKLRGTLAGADVGTSLTSDPNEIADLLTGPKKPKGKGEAARDGASAPAEEGGAELGDRSPSDKPEGASEAARIEGSQAEAPAEASAEADAAAEPQASTETGSEPAGGGGAVGEAEGASPPTPEAAPPGSAAPSGEAPPAPKRPRGRPRKRKRAGEEGGGGNVTGLTSQYLGDSLYRLPSGAVGARPTFYLREDQMTALRASVAARVDFFGRTITEAAQCLFDLMGYSAAHMDVPYLDAPEGVPIFEPLITRRQWAMLLERAEELCGGEELTEHDLMRAVSWLVQDALYEKGFGDGRSRKKDFKP